MYSLKSAIAKPLKGDGRWKTVAIGDIPLYVLFATYSQIIATLAHTLLDHEVSLNLDAIRPALGGTSTTFNEFLLQNGAQSLPTSDTLPVLKPRFAKYADGFHAGYKVSPIHPTASADAQLPTSEKTALHLTRPDTDYYDFVRHCLVSVNGFYHFIDGDTKGVYVYEGMKSCWLSGENQFGILSFKDIGEIRCVPIKKEMLYKQNPDQLYRNRCFLELGEDLTDKTVLLVLGGYLHALDTRSFFRVKPSAFCIDFGNFPLMERFYESKQYIDYSSLPLEKTGRNPNQVAIENFYSDANIEAYLMLSQSFFVILDNPNLFAEHVKIRKTKMPDMYVSDIKPVYPLITGFGKASNYWAHFEDGQYSVNCHDSMRPNFLFDTVDVQKLVSTSNARLPYNPVQNSNPFFLRIGVDF